MVVPVQGNFSVLKLGIASLVTLQFLSEILLILRRIQRDINVHWSSFNLLKPTGHVMHHQFNIQQLYALPTLYLCVLYLSENKQRLVPLTA